MIDTTTSATPANNTAEMPAPEPEYGPAAWSAHVSGKRPRTRQPKRADVRSSTTDAGMRTQATSATLDHARRRSASHTVTRSDDTLTTPSTIAERAVDSDAVTSASDHGGSVPGGAEVGGTLGDVLLGVGAVVVVVGATVVLVVVVVVVVVVVGGAPPVSSKTNGLPSDDTPNRDHPDVSGNVESSTGPDPRFTYPRNVDPATAGTTSYNATVPDDTVSVSVAATSFGKYTGAEVVYPSRVEVPESGHTRAKLS